jgi:hypothetical protein
MGASHSRLRKQHQNVIRQAAKLADRCAEIYAIWNASLIDRYKQADCQLCIRHVGPSGHQYGFLVEALPIPDFNLGVRQAGIKRHSGWKNARGQKTAMFPGQVELMEGAKQIIPSRIWLQLFDDSLMELGKPLYLFQSGISLVASGRVKSLLALPDGEIGIGRIRKPVPGRKGTRKKIQAASDAVHDCPRLRANQGIEGFDLCEAIKLFSGLRLGIYSNGVGLTAPPLEKAFHKHWELGYGPIDCSFSL